MLDDGDDKQESNALAMGRNPHDTGDMIYNDLSHPFLVQELAKIGFQHFSIERLTHTRRGPLVQLYLPFICLVVSLVMFTNKSRSLLRMHCLELWPLGQATYEAKLWSDGIHS